MQVILEGMDIYSSGQLSCIDCIKSFKFSLKPFQIIATSIEVGDDDALLKCLVDLAESCPKFLRPQVETILQLAIKV